MFRTSPSRTSLSRSTRSQALAVCALLAASIIVADAQRGGGGGGGVGGGGFGGGGTGGGRGAAPAGGRGAVPQDPGERGRPNPQDDTPTFRSRVTLVQIDAIVTDAAGNQVTGLKEEDFEIREAGKPRDITTFAAVDIPVPTDG